MAPVLAAEVAKAAATAGSSAKAFNPLVQSTCAVLNLVACCCVGVTASKARVLDAAAVSALSRLVYNVFQPSLLFTNVMQTLAAPSSGGQSKATLLLLPLAAALQILVASIVSAGVIRLANIPPDSEEGRETRVCSTFANSGPLPLLFVDALFKTHPDPTLRPRAVALISFYLLAWSPLFWNYGYSLLVPDRRSRRVEETLLLSKKDVLQRGASAAGMTAAYTKSGAAPWVRLHRAMMSPAVRQLLNPPTLGCTLGAVAGLVPPVRRLFLGEGAPLSSLFEALRTMGAAYVPCVLLVLAGSLAQGLEGFDAGLIRRAAVVMGQRFLIMPALTVALVAAGKRAGVIPAHDPLPVFILLLQGCMPNAQNSVLILQLEKRPQAAASMARLTSTVYVLSILPIGILLQAILSRSPLFQ